MFARVGLALLAVQRGDVGAIGEQYAALESRQGTMLDGGIAAADRLLGLMAQTVGNLDQAVAHFEGALVSSARLATVLSWPGPAATMPMPCSSATTLATGNRPTRF